MPITYRNNQIDRLHIYTCRARGTRDPSLSYCRPLRSLSPPPPPCISEFLPCRPASRPLLAGSGQIEKSSMQKVLLEMNIARGDQPLLLLLLLRLLVSLIIPALWTDDFGALTSTTAARQSAPASSTRRRRVGISGPLEINEHQCLSRFFGHKFRGEPL